MDQEKNSALARELQTAKNYALAALAATSALMVVHGETPQRRLIRDTLVEAIDRLNGELRHIGRHLLQEERKDA